MIGYLYVLAAACLWGLIGPLSRLAFASGWTPLEVAFWRAALAGLLFGLHALRLGRVCVARRDLPIVVAFGLVGVALFYASFQFAVQAGGGAMAAVLLYTAPAWVALLSWIFLKEAMGPRKLAALTLTAYAMPVGALALLPLVSFHPPTVPQRIIICFTPKGETNDRRLPASATRGS